MLPNLNTTSVQIEMNTHAPVCENLEEFAQKHCSIVVLPTLRDRVASWAGQHLIAAGEKLTASGSKNKELSKEIV